MKAIPTSIALAGVLLTPVLMLTAPAAEAPARPGRTFCISCRMTTLRTPSARTPAVSIRRRRSTAWPRKACDSTAASVRTRSAHPAAPTIITGKYSHLNGVPVFNRFDGSQPTVAKYLQAGGYYTA